MRNHSVLLECQCVSEDASDDWHGIMLYTIDTRGKHFSNMSEQDVTLNITVRQPLCHMNRVKSQVFNLADQSNRVLYKAIDLTGLFEKVVHQLI